MSDAQNQTVSTVAGRGLLACHHCGTVWRGAQVHEPCARCGTLLHRRKPDSLNRTWALIIAAAILYLPANLLPVMITRTIFGAQYDTIMSGIIYFWVSGAWGLAAIIFIASFLVPLFKLAAMTTLAWTAGHQSDWCRQERSTLYRIIEFIGRWSMLDVFVVCLLTGLVHIQGFAEISAGLGIAAFGSVVVLTMLASISFDPRLIWDAAPVHDNIPAAEEPRDMTTKRNGKTA